MRIIDKCFFFTRILQSDAIFINHVAYKVKVQTHWYIKTLDPKINKYINKLIDLLLKLWFHEICGC